MLLRCPEPAGQGRFDVIFDPIPHDLGHIVRSRAEANSTQPRHQRNAGTDDSSDGDLPAVRGVRHAALPPPAVGTAVDDVDASAALGQFLGGWLTEPGGSIGCSDCVTCQAEATSSASRSSYRGSRAAAAVVSSNGGGGSAASSGAAGVIWCSSVHWATASPGNHNVQCSSSGLSPTEREELGVAGQDVGDGA